MIIDTSIAIATITAVVGIATWSLRQEGRINGHDSMFEERKDQLASQMFHIHASAVQRHEDTQNRLDRIEAKLDRLPWGLSTKA